MPCVYKPCLIPYASMVVGDGGEMSGFSCGLWGVGWPSGIGWGDNVRSAVGSSPAPPTVRVAM